jgi:hypothetical protein
MSDFGATGGYRGSTGDQPRVRVGTPAGGQFALTIHGEPDVSLTELSDAEYNADGTFEFPPLPRSAAQHVAFWSRVPVSNAILARVCDAYVVLWAAWSKEQMREWDAAHSHPALARGKTDQSLVAAWQARRAAAVEALPERRPPTIERPLARTVVRATQMCRFADYWLEPEAEADLVLSFEMDLGDDEPVTVEGIVDRFMMRELAASDFEDAATYAGVNAAETVTALNELLNRLSNEDGEG